MDYCKEIIKYSVAGILLGVGFLFPALWVIGILGVVFLLKELLNETSIKKVLFGGGLAWFVKFLFVLGFYWSMYPIRWLPFDFGHGELWLIGLYWVTVALFLGTGGLVLAASIQALKLFALHKQRISYLTIPLIWVVSEIVGSFMLSLFTLGPGSELNTYFSLGYIGLLVAEHPMLLQFAHIAGVYSLSFLVVFLSVWLLNIKLISSSKRNTWIAGFLFILWVSSFWSNFPPADKSELKSVAVVSTSFPVQELFNRESVPQLKEMKEASLSSALETKADYIIFPEDSRIFNQTTDINNEISIFNFLHSESSSVIVDSGRIGEEGAGILQGLIFDSGTGKYATAHKRYLVPQGEFVPYIYEWFFRVIGFRELMDGVTDLVSYEIGANTNQSKLNQEYPGLLFCFESASATGVKSLLNERPNLPFIAHPVSHSWFHTPESFWSQLDSALQVQAVWNNVAIVSAGNHAPSKMFLPNGKIVIPETVDSGEYWSVGIVDVPIK